MGSANSDRDGLALSVVIPVKDETGNIQPLLDEVAAAMKPRSGRIARLAYVLIPNGAGDCR